MKFACIFFLVLLPAITAAAQAPSPKEPPKCSIKGLVVKEPGGQPLKKANVEARSLDQEENKTYKATTDAEGHFEIDGVEAGRYNIRVERPGFLELKQHNLRSGGHTLTLNAGEEIKDLLFQMQPPAVIVGKVLDGDGDPLTNVSILVTRFGVPKSGWRAFAGQNMTNDLGEYRIGNLSPGKYLIKAIPMRSSMDEAEARNRDGTKQLIPYPTYYPGTPDKNQAVPLELHAGDEVPLNMNMATGPSFHIRGVMTGLMHSSGEIYVMLRTKGDLPWLSEVYSKVKDDGSFEVTNVVPGSYQAVFLTSSGADSEAVEAAQTIEVKDADLDSLKLTPELPARIVGRVRAENNPKLDWTHFSIKLESDAESDDNQLYFMGGPSTDGSVKTDGSFEMKKVPSGKYHLSLYSRGTELQSYYIKSVSLGSSDVTDSGFAISGGLLSLEILLSSNCATIEGAVIDGKDQPVKDAMVVAVPGKELRKRKDTFKQVTTDQRGHFVLNGLRPGEYTILSVEGMEDEDYHDPAFLKRYEDLENVHVDAGEHKSVVAKLITETTSR